MGQARSLSDGKDVPPLPLRSLPLRTLPSCHLSPETQCPVGSLSRRPHPLRVRRQASEACLRTGMRWTAVGGTGGRTVMILPAVAMTALTGRVVPARRMTAGRDVESTKNGTRAQVLPNRAPATR